MVPHFLTAQSGPIQELEQRILDMLPAIESWFRSEWMEHPPVFYSAVNVRNARFKTVAVDSYLYPDNWQRLSPAMLPYAVQASVAMFDKNNLTNARLLIVARKGDVSPDYVANLAQLKSIFEMAGMIVRVGSIDAKLKKPISVPVHHGHEKLLMEPLQRDERNSIGFPNFFDCAIVFNDYLQDGIPGFLEDISNKVIGPPLQSAWCIRRRHIEYEYYAKVCKRFAELIGVDPWLLSALYEPCGALDLGEDSNIPLMAEKANLLFNRIRRKNKEYGLDAKPFAVLKRDDKKLGAQIISFDNLRQFEMICKKLWAYPQMVEGVDLPEFVLQEGVYASDLAKQEPSEMIVNTIGRQVVGAHYRTKTTHLVMASRGSLRIPLDCSPSSMTLRSASLRQRDPNRHNRFYLYGVLARLAVLAASCEVENASVPVY